MVNKYDFGNQRILRNGNFRLANGGKLSEVDEIEQR